MKKTEPKKKWIKGENPVGRPSELAATLEKAKWYLNGGYLECKEVIPSIAGLACYTMKGRNNIYEYGKQSEEFKNILEGILRLQESILLNSGLTGAFNSTITKLVLTKHGYSDKIEQDIKAEVKAPSLSEFYAVNQSEPEPEA